MPTPSVIEGVKVVHSQLGEVRPTAGESSNVDVLQRQLETVILEPEHKHHYESLGERLRAAYADFSSNHPSLAASMESLANELSKAGL